jgi:hypothetical protein
MALLTGPRNTPRKDLDSRLVPMGLEANTTIYLGGLVCSDDNGLAYPAQTKTGSAPLVNLPIVMGVAERVVGGVFGENAVNQVGASEIPSPPNLGSAGALTLEVRSGIFLLDNDGTITAANIGHLCYASDDHTVTTTSTNNPIAGQILGFETLYGTTTAMVWVDTRIHAV